MISRLICNFSLSDKFCTPTNSKVDIELIFQTFLIAGHVICIELFECYNYRGQVLTALVLFASFVVSMMLHLPYQYNFNKVNLKNILQNGVL